MIVKTDITLAAIVSAWKHGPCSAIALHDMIELFAPNLVFGLEYLNTIERIASLYHSSQKGPLVVEERERRALLGALSGLKKVCHSIGLDATVVRIDECVRRFSDTRDIYECVQQTVCTEVDAIKRLLIIEIGEICFVVVPKNKTGFCNSKSPFGAGVFRAFPSARREIKDASNCLAVGLDTASVFHLMRVMELGMRAAARHLRIIKVKKHVPITFGTWEEIIVALGKKLETLSGTTRGHKRQAKLDFYNGLLLELRSVKDFWRNKVMHTRDEYDEHQAMSAYLHTRAFMQRLALGVSENN
jgi:hypothetical protein